MASLVCCQPSTGHPPGFTFQFKGDIFTNFVAEIAQLGERQKEDLKVLGSIPGFGKYYRSLWMFVNWEQRLVVGK